MHLPLIVDDHGELKLFASASSLEGYLEAIDIQNGEYVVYDGEGRLVELTTEQVPTQLLFGVIKGTAEVVRIVRVEEEPTHAAELATKVRAMLHKLDLAGPLDAPLADLLAKLHDRLGFVA